MRVRSRNRVVGRNLGVNHVQIYVFERILVGTRLKIDEVCGVFVPRWKFKRF